MSWDVVIGIETHVQLKTRNKIFSRKYKTNLLNMSTAIKESDFDLDLNLKDGIESINTMKFKLFIKENLKNLIGNKIYEIKEINIKDNGLLIDAFYYYIPTEKPEDLRIIIKDVSDGFNSENVVFIFDE